MSAVAALLDPSARMAALIAGTDYFRRPAPRGTERSDHKEWQHFLVCTNSVHLIVNFNLTEEAWADGRAGSESARLVVLARSTGEGWDGDVERFDAAEVEVSAGRIDARFGRNTMRFDRGRYHLSIALRERPLAAELELAPVTPPMLSPHRPLSRERRISWLVVPRLAARGTISVGCRSERVSLAPAYHDHNWGHFRWGDDFSWEWGSILPADPESEWSAVHVRMADLGRSVLRYQGLTLWRGAEPLRVFLDEEIRVEREGWLDLRRPLTIPRVMAMLSPGAAGDVPRRIDIVARGGGDELSVRFLAEDAARVVIPSEIDPEGVTILHEVSGRVVMEGRVRGARVGMEGPGVFELVRS